MTTFAYVSRLDFRLQNNGQSVDEDHSLSYSGFMRAMTWRPIASVRPVARMGIGISDMMDLVMIDLHELPHSVLGIHNEDISVYVGKIQRIVTGSNALSPEHIRSIISQSTGV